MLMLLAEATSYCSATSRLLYCTHTHQQSACPLTPDQAAPSAPAPLSGRGARSILSRFRAAARLSLTKAQAPIAAPQTRISQQRRQDDRQSQGATAHTEVARASAANTLSAHLASIPSSFSRPRPPVQLLWSSFRPVDLTLLHCGWDPSR
jgi:hypothetical protein